MAAQLGSMPFSDKFYAELSIGYWVIEKLPNNDTEMYVDTTMAQMLGLREQASPSDIYRACFARIDKNYADAYSRIEQLMRQGVHAEIQFKWYHPDGRTLLLSCEGVRNEQFTQGIRIEGSCRNITGVESIQKQANVISALIQGYACVNYVWLNDDKFADVVIPFHSSRRIQKIIPKWDHETSVHNRLQLLVEYVGDKDEIDSFIALTRREVVLKKLQENSSYTINTKACIDGKTEHMQVSFIADKDSDGKIKGYVLCIRSTEEEERNEIERRESVEKLVAEQTIELKKKNEAISAFNERIISMVGDIVEWRDSQSGGHIKRVKHLTNVLGMQVLKDIPEYKLTVQDVHNITVAAPLHDIGKICIPDNILLAQRKLNKEEFEIMKTHCVKGYNMIKSLENSWNKQLMQIGLDICRYHHEKWDGKGYPYGLRGNQIPISAQIVSIADVYDALVSDRPYKKGLTHEEAYSMIMEGKCGKYSEKLLSCLSKCKEAFASADSHSEDTVYTLSDNTVRDVLNCSVVADSLPLVAQITESMPGGFFIYQADGDEKLIYFNDIISKYFGCSSREEFISYTGNSFRGMVHPDDYAFVEQQINKQINANTDKLDHVIYRIRKKDGSVVHLNDYGRLVKTNDMGDLFFVFAYEFKR